MLAYFSYQVAVVIGMAAIGFTIGTTVMAAVGVGSQAATVAVGLVAGALLAVIAIATDLPAVILVVLTALAGASVTVAGVMVIAGTIGINRLTAEGVSAEMSRGWWWYVLYGGLALLGIIAQLRARVPWSPHDAPAVGLPGARRFHQPLTSLRSALAEAESSRDP